MYCLHKQLGITEIEKGSGASDKYIFQLGGETVVGVHGRS